jgi:hexosaminidase
MKAAAFCITLVFLNIICLCQNNTSIAIIPEPVKLTKTTGDFTLPQNVIIHTVKSTELKQAAIQLQERFSVPTGYKTTLSDNAASATIKLELNQTADATLGNEGYTLSVKINVLLG